MGYRWTYSCTALQTQKMAHNITITPPCDFSIKNDLNRCRGFDTDYCCYKLYLTISSIKVSLEVEIHQTWSLYRNLEIYKKSSQGKPLTIRNRGINEAALGEFLKCEETLPRKATIGFLIESGMVMCTGTCSYSVPRCFEASRCEHENEVRGGPLLTNTQRKEANEVAMLSAISRCPNTGATNEPPWGEQSVETVLGKAGLAALVFGFWGASPHPGIIEGLSLFLFSQTGSAIHTVNGDSGDVLHTHQEAVRFGV